MPPKNRDLSILEHIIKYCDDIEAAVQRFGDNYTVFCEDDAYRYACSMCVLQIGELVAHLSPNFRAKHPETPWAEIKAMRNVVVHAYSSIDVKTVWETMQRDIPALKAFCKAVLEATR